MVLTVLLTWTLVSAKGRCCVARSADALSLATQASDRLGEFGERRGDPQCRAGVDSEFEVAAAQILEKGVASDHHLRRPISL